MRAKVGKVYKHLKTGRFYKVLNIAIHTETEEDLVIYHQVHFDKLGQPTRVWARPWNMFCDGRFEKVEQCMDCDQYKPDATMRVERGLEAGVHCDNCWKVMIEGCRKRSW